jgi:hypothetical protein
MISAELEAGIRAYHAAVEALGGYGARVTATMSDGRVVTGELGEAGFGGCQPIITCTEGRRYRVDIRSVEAAP